MSETPAAPARGGLPMGRAAGIAIALLAVIFLSVNIIAQEWLGGARLDFTENRIYSLSAASKQLVQEIDEPITLTFYFSRAAASDFPQLAAYAKRVRDLLESLRQRSRGRLIVRAVEPEPFSPEEDEAAAAGLTAAPAGGDRSVYFGLVGENAIDGREAIAFFSPEREAFLEYDVVQLIDRLNTPEPPTVGLLTSLPLAMGRGGAMAMMQGGGQPFQIYELLNEVYDLKAIPAAVTPEELGGVEVLMIAQPPALEASAVRAIDQFVLGGGRALILLDPVSGLAPQPGLGGQPGAGPDGNPDALAPLLAAWGVDFAPDQVVLDLGRALRVGLNDGGRYVERSYPLWIGLEAQDRDPGDPAVADLSRAVNMASVGAFAPVDGASTAFAPLIRTSEQAMPVAAERAMFDPQPDDLLKGYLPADERFVVAARVTGPVQSAFVAGDDADGASAEGDGPRAEGEINVVLVADTDLLDDRFFVSSNAFFTELTADNAAFLLNAVDNLLGSDALLALRARAPSNRPMTVVDDLRVRAETQYLIEEQRLQAELEATQARLSELEERRGGEAQAASAALSSEEQAEIARFQLELAKIRSDLREVRRRLNADIVALEQRLVFFNVWAVPLILTLILVLRSRRRRGARPPTTAHEAEARAP